MGKEKNIMMPASFLNNVYELIFSLDRNSLDYNTKSLVTTIEKQIIAKCEAIERHNAFGEYKATTPGTNIREEKRKEYIEITGIHKNFQTQKETPYGEL